MPQSPKKPTPAKSAAQPLSGQPRTPEQYKVQGAPELPHAVARQYGLHEPADGHAVPVVHTKPATITHDPLTDAAVDDIAATESDALLAAEDAARMAASPKPVKRGFWRSIGHFFAAWWRNKWARYSTLLIIVAALAAVVVIQPARYYVLNAAGVRSSASVIALDATTRLPLRNVTVSVAGETTKTNVDGVATLHGLELGPTTLHIKRVAFAPYALPVTIGWGSNPFGEYRLQATGVQYTVIVTDYLSGKPLADAEAVSDQANALSDKDGKLVITVADTNETTLEAQITRAGYRTETVTLNAEAEQTARLALVPDQKHVFVDRQNGRSDVYTIDLDGKNKQVLLPATGNETSNMSLAASPDYAYVAVVSTRDGMRDTDGYVLPALTLINTSTGTAEIIDHGSQIQLMGWVDNRIVYRRGASGASAANAQRYRIVSYNAESQGKLQLTSANQFTVSRIANGYVYYAASGNDPKAPMGLFRIKTDGSGKERVFTGEVWTAYRDGYETMLLQTPTDWFRYDMGSKAAAKTTAPSVFEPRAYLDDSKAKYSLWVASGDTASLMVHDIQKRKDKRLVSQDGMTSQLRWIDNTAIIYRVSTATETADYAVSPQGGKARKITDATVSYGASFE